MGKPRRFSEAFLREERTELERKRKRIRLLQQRKLADAQVLVSSWLGKSFFDDRYLIRTDNLPFLIVHRFEKSYLCFPIKVKKGTGVCIPILCENHTPPPPFGKRFFFFLATCCIVHFWLNFPLFCWRYPFSFLSFIFFTFHLFIFPVPHLLPQGLAATAYGGVGGRVVDPDQKLFAL